MMLSLLALIGLFQPILPPVSPSATQTTIVACEIDIVTSALDVLGMSLDYTDSAGATKQWNVKVLPSTSPGVWLGKTNAKKYEIKVSLSNILADLKKKSANSALVDKINQELASNGGHSSTLCGIAFGVLVHEFLHVCLGSGSDDTDPMSCSHLAIDIKSSKVLCTKATDVRCDEIRDLQSEIDNETDPVKLAELAVKMAKLEGFLAGVCAEIEKLNDKWEASPSDPNYQKKLAKVTACATHGLAGAFPPNGPPSSCISSSDYPTVEPSTGSFYGALSETIPECDACDPLKMCP